MSDQKLISNIKHDLNSNLVLILEANQMLQECNKSGLPRHDLHKNILQSVRGLQTTINQLMAACDLKQGIQVDFSIYKTEGNYEKS